MLEPKSRAIGDQITDEEVVARVVAGDRALFEILMRRHNQRIYRAVRAVLRTRSPPCVFRRCRDVGATGDGALH